MSSPEKVTDAKVALFAPLRERRFALILAAAAVTLLGDGLYFVALAWAVYSVSDAPTTLAIVWLAFNLPHALALLFGGALCDRLDRRLLLVVSTLASGLAVSSIGLLALSHQLSLWTLLIPVAFYGASEAVYGPSFDAAIPDCCERASLPQANALYRFVRPITLRIAGPILGGVTIATLGVAATFLLDGASFAASALVLLALGPLPAAPAEIRGKIVAEIKAGIRYARSVGWLWTTLLMSGVRMLVVWGPLFVLVPYLCKHSLGGGASAYGKLLAAGGVGAIIGSLAIGKLGLPRSRPLPVLYLFACLEVLSMAGLGLSPSLPVAMVAAACYFGFASIGMVMFGTLLGQRVPRELLGRVSSLDWLTSTVPILASYALVGPLAALLGASTTMVGAALLGLVGIVTIFACSPSLRHAGA
jgi:DHA3 family tetracycline resistance protein-like MFS transporter